MMGSQVEVMLLDHNRGKAEAVRIGMCHARAQGKQYVGYWDSDLSTPLNEILDFMVCCTKSILFCPCMWVSLSILMNLPFSD